MLSHVRFFATAGTAAHQVPLSMEFSRQEYWSHIPGNIVLPFPPPGDLPDSGIQPVSPSLLHWQADSLPHELPITVPYKLFYISKILQ